MAGLVTEHDASVILGLSVRTLQNRAPPLDFRPRNGSSEGSPAAETPRLTHGDGARKTLLFGWNAIQANQKPSTTSTSSGASNAKTCASAS